uniref:Ribonuclease A-domain domain-containing protein n=1 Tax=Oryzias latipes TaxID=8090 RepID=A0A3B3HMY3_ORYLA
WFLLNAFWKKVLRICSCFGRKAEKPTDVATYEMFRWQHIHDQMKAGNCDDEMKPINKNWGNGRSCKDQNTFIVSSEPKVQKICKDKGIADGKFTWSTEMFKIVNCDWVKTSTYPHCEYKGTHEDQMYLKVECRNKEPIHYHVVNGRLATALDQ